MNLIHIKNDLIKTEQVDICNLQNNFIEFQKKSNSNTGRYIHIYTYHTKKHGSIELDFNLLHSDFPNLDENDINAICNILDVLSKKQIDKYKPDYTHNPYLQAKHYDIVRKNTDKALNTFKDWQTLFVTSENIVKKDLQTLNVRQINKRKKRLLSAMVELCNVINDMCISVTGEPGIIIGEGAPMFGVFEIHTEGKVPDLHSHILVQCNKTILEAAGFIKKNKYTFATQFYELINTKMKDKKLISGKFKIAHNFKIVYDVFALLKEANYFHKTFYNTDFDKKYKIPYFRVSIAENLKELETKYTLQGDEAYCVMNELTKTTKKPPYQPISEKPHKYNDVRATERYEVKDKNNDIISVHCKAYIENNMLSLDKIIQYVLKLKDVYNILGCDYITKYTGHICRNFVDFYEAVSYKLRTIEDIEKFTDAIPEYEWLRDWYIVA